MHALAIGDGDNDGNNEVYGANANNHLYRFNYSGNSWYRTDMGTPYEPLPIEAGAEWGMWALAVGDVDSDGRNEVYASSIFDEFGNQNGSIWQYKWNPDNSSWNLGKLIDLDWCTLAEDLSIGDCDADGRQELYMGIGTYYNNGQVDKLLFDNETQKWSCESIGNSDGTGWKYFIAIAIGSATNDTRQNEIYAACANGHAYQFLVDNFPPMNPVVWSDTHPETGLWYNNSDVHILWKDQGHDYSGIGGYSYQWETASGAILGKKDVDGAIHESRTRLNDGANYTFHIRACDGLSNWNQTDATYGPISIDTAPPRSLKITVNDGAAYTNNPDVKLSLSATELQPASGLGSMSFSNDGRIWSDWIPFCTTFAGWNITDNRFGGDDTDGEKSVYFKARDLVGNKVSDENASTAPIFLDRAPPAGLGLVINGGAGYTANANVSLGVFAFDPEPASGLDRMAFSNDGAVWSDWTGFSDSADWSLTQDAGGNDLDGNKAVFLKILDSADNVGGPISASIILDRNSPEELSLMINGGAPFTNSPIVDLSIAARDSEPGSNISEMALSNDVSSRPKWEPFNISKPSWDLVGAGGTDSDGPKNVYLSVQDRAGNVAGPVPGDIFLDRVRPAGLSLSINQGAGYTVGPVVNLSLCASDVEPSSGIQAMQFSQDSLDWTGWEPFQSCRTYTFSGPDGARTVFFRVKDLAGNIADAVSDSIILDTGLPVISGITVSGVTPKTALITWSTGEKADSVVDYGPTADYGMSDSDGPFVIFHSVLLTNLTPGTTYHFRAASRDMAGNGPAHSDDRSFTTTRKDDFIPPMISDVQVMGVTDRLAVIGWRTNEPADSAVEYRPSAVYGRNAADGRFVLVHSLTLDGLSPSTSYHFRVLSRDASGNGPSFCPDMSFSTLSLPDTKPPAISGVEIVAVSDKLAVISWRTDEAADSSIEFGTGAPYGRTATDPSLLLFHQLTLNGLEPSTTYHFRVGSTDASGNGPSNSGDLTFTTKTLPDTTPPVVSGIRISNLTGSSALITWKTDEAADSFLEFGTTDSYGIPVEDDTFTVHHSLLLLNLTPGRTYHFRVYSSDPSGNRAGPTKDMSFSTPGKTTRPEVDATGPGTLGLLAFLFFLVAAAVALLTKARKPPVSGKTVLQAESFADSK